MVANEVAKLGQPLRHLPSANLDANGLWLTSCLLALNITAMVCDISPAAGASGNAPDATPLSDAKALHQILFCVPARITRSARQTTLHLPEGFRHQHVSRRPTKPPTHSASHRSPAAPSQTTSANHPPQLGGPPTWRSPRPSRAARHPQRVNGPARARSSAHDTHELTATASQLAQRRGTSATHRCRSEFPLIWALWSRAPEYLLRTTTKRGRRPT
jgi:hypothetical protein